MSNDFIKMAKDIRSALWTAGETPAMFYANDILEKELCKQSGLSIKEWNKEMGYAPGKGLDEPDRTPPSVRDGAVKITVIYEAYERFATGNICMMHIEGDTIRDAVLKLFAYDGFNVDLDTLQEREEAQGCECTIEELMDMVDEGNGDGYDCILCIRNDYTGEQYYWHDMFQESSWDGENKTIIN